MLKKKVKEIQEEIITKVEKEWEEILLTNSKVVKLAEKKVGELQTNSSYDIILYDYSIDSFHFFVDEDKNEIKIQSTNWSCRPRVKFERGKIMDLATKDLKGNIESINVDLKFNPNNGAPIIKLSDYKYDEDNPF